MGNYTETCCSKRVEVPISTGFSAIMKPGQDKKFKEFMDQYSVKQIQSNCNGGLVENYICVEKEDLENHSNSTQQSKSARKLMQSLEIDHVGVNGMKAQHKLAIVMDLDPDNQYLDIMNDWFVDGS